MSGSKWGLRDREIDGWASQESRLSRLSFAIRWAWENQGRLKPPEHKDSDPSHVAMNIHRRFLTRGGGGVGVIDRQPQLLGCEIYDRICSEATLPLACTPPATEQHRGTCGRPVLGRRRGGNLLGRELGLKDSLAASADTKICSPDTSSAQPSPPPPVLALGSDL